MKFSTAVTLALSATFSYAAGQGVRGGTETAVLPPEGSLLVSSDVSAKSFTPDPTCATGIVSPIGSACCPSECGVKCAADNCNQGTNCCVGPPDASDGGIHGSGRSCNDFQPPCIIPDPTCATGIVSPIGSACCPSECGDKCAAGNCNQGANCCVGPPDGSGGGIHGSGRSCNDFQPPCIIELSPTAEPTTMATPQVLDSFTFKGQGVCVTTSGRTFTDIPSDERVHFGRIPLSAEDCAKVCKGKHSSDNNFVGIEIFSNGKFGICACLMGEEDIDRIIKSEEFSCYSYNGVSGVEQNLNGNNESKNGDDEDDTEVTAA